MFVSKYKSIIVRPKIKKIKPVFFFCIVPLFIKCQNVELLGLKTGFTFFMILW